MNVSRKFPLIHHITKGLTPRSSFAPKARIMLKAKEILCVVRLSPLLSTPASFAPPPLGSFPDRGDWGWRVGRDRAPRQCAVNPNSLQQPPLPLLGKEGSQPTNSPPRLRRGPGGGDCRVIRASWQIVKRDDTLVFPSCSSRTAARIIWLPWLGEPFGSRCTAKKAHRLRLFDPASQRTRKPSGARERPTLATRRVFSSNPALVGEMRCFQVGSDRDHFKDSRIG